MKYKAVIYDLDGTLVDTIAMNMYPLMKIIEEELGEKRTYDEVKHFFGLPGKDTLEALGIDYETVYPRWVQYVNEYEEGAKPFDGIIEMMRQVHEQGFIQAVVSSKTHKQYVIDVKEDINQYIVEKVLVEDTMKHKPHPEPLLKCLERLHIKPHEAIYVGDASVDGLCAQSAGTDFAWANWIGLVNSEMKEYIELKHPSDLLEVIKGE